MKYIVDGKDLQAIANCIRNLNSSSEPLTINTMVAKLKELDDKQSTQRTYKITFNPINCETTGCHNSGINCSGWDLTEYNQGLADATAFVNAEGFIGEVPEWVIPAVNHKLGSCIGDTCSGDDKCGNCHGGTAATPCSPITINYTVTRTKLILINFSIDGVNYTARQGMGWKEWTESEYNIDNWSIQLGASGSYMQALFNSSGNHGIVLSSQNELILNNNNYITQSLSINREPV